MMNIVSISFIDYYFCAATQGLDSHLNGIKIYKTGWVPKDLGVFGLRKAAESD